MKKAQTSNENPDINKILPTCFKVVSDPYSLIL
jgi:hypothetical protein